MNEAGKLYVCTSNDLQLPYAVIGAVVRHYHANDIPLLFWPDGSVCWLANMYMLQGYRRGFSRKNKGGTLLTWAKHLSPLIRWCYENKCDFFDLTDSHFRMFVNTLMSEADEKRPELMKRSLSQVAAICGTVMHFLEFIGQKIPNLNLIGSDGRIQAENKVFEIKLDKGIIRRRTWFHECVPNARQARRRQPISTYAVNRLFDANSNCNAPPFIIRRRYIMLRLLEMTGGRRIEIAQIRLEDLNQALVTGELKIFSAKQRQDDACRMVPVTKADLKDVMSFVKHYRQRIVRNTIGTGNDHGYLLVSMENGAPLKIDTLGSELYILRKIAGIEDEEACLHAFRHRYITNIFRNLIKTHYYESESDLKKLLLSTETLKLKVMEWSGHRHIDSLNHYIHLAFEAESGFHHTLDILHACKIVESLLYSIKDCREQLHRCSSVAQLLSDFEESVSTASMELANLISSKDSAEEKLEH